jgi:hypothetical protein
MTTANVIKIGSRITGYLVEKPRAPEAEAPAPAVVAASDVVSMNEALERPEILIGSTYKLKSPAAEHAMYVTINDIVLNEGTPHEQRRPFEMFINSKNLDHYQWIVALTRIISAVFRKGGDVVFLVEEMKAVFDPKGGYWLPGGRYMNSIIAELGHTLERHLKTIGLMGPDELDEEQQKLIEDKRAAFEALTKQESERAASQSESSFPPSATLCGKCHTKAVALLDGCSTCLNCGQSKCG